MSQLSSTMVCRPSSSGTVLVVASYHMDIARPSYAEEVEPPSDYEVCRLVQQRVRMHFNNRGKIELDRFVLHYLVYVDEPCPLIYVCIAEPARSFDSAQEYLSTFQYKPFMNHTPHCVTHAKMVPLLHKIPAISKIFSDDAVIIDRSYALSSIRL
uniref:ADF-H domain-containing protein n=1 Tax=Heterorhabditis bacteriophora TaxID=37862 RepID=A0A1I7XDH5_HETBA